jgi:hypothetical protein
VFGPVVPRAAGHKKSFQKKCSSDLIIRGN